MSTTMAQSVTYSILNIVLLPAPLGPLRPRISPCSTRNDTLLTAVKPPKRLVSPSTVSTPTSPPALCDRSLERVGRGGRQRQDGLAALEALRPHDVGVVVHVLDDDGERAVVLPCHRRALALELDAEAKHRAALGQ